METIIILTLVIVIGWILFRPIKKKELDRYNDKDKLVQYQNNQLLIFKRLSELKKFKFQI